MKRTLIVTSSNRHMMAKTRDAIDACRMLGAREVRQTGSADVAFARNHALTLACEVVRSVQEELEPIDVVLMVDDDIDFDADKAVALVSECRARDRPCSGLYVTINQLPAAEVYVKHPATGKQLWQVGLGFLAIRAADLLKLEHASRHYGYRAKLNGELRRTDMVEFTWSGVVEREGENVWLSEDFVLCRQFGGVYLLPIEVGHVKTFAIWPHTNMVEQLRNADH